MPRRRQSPSGEMLSSAFSVEDLAVVVSAEEAAAQEMAPATVCRLTALMREHGAVLLTGPIPLIPHADLDKIGAQLEFQSALAAAEVRHQCSRRPAGVMHDGVHQRRRAPTRKI